MSDEAMGGCFIVVAFVLVACVAGATGWRAGVDASDQCQAFAHRRGLVWSKAAITNGEADCVIWGEVDDVCPTYDYGDCEGEIAR